MKGFYAIVALGLLFHSVYLFSIFDIYFRSPLVHGMPTHSISLAPAAKRLVLFVADGLRADKFFEKTNTDTGMSRAPFLRDIIEAKGSWGVSQTRVPTETRPGHVALIAGFYEDVSAVTKGWKYNPVEFDSVFNRSTYTWGYGSPDVLPMFSEDIPHMFTETYSSDDENFAGNATYQLDSWVFDRISALLATGSSNTTLGQHLRTPGVVLFLHLLALDTFGHARRPNSTEYLKQISFVDAGIRRITAEIDEFYNDNATAYVFTADHGMSDKGNHGDGEKANTNTPLVCWGAGVSGPQKVTERSGTRLAFPAPPEWDLSHLVRRDVNQADIAALMAGLLGIPFPVNSVGVLPVDYLEGSSSHYSAASLFQNALAILEQFLTKSGSKESSSVFFSSFKPLQNHSSVTQEISKYIEDSNYKAANKLSSHLIELSLAGLSYFQKYDWPFLIITVSAGYLGWIFVVAIFVVERYTAYNNRRSRSSSVLPALIPAVIGALLSVYLVLQHSPFMYYLYMAFPVGFWVWILKRTGFIVEVLKRSFIQQLWPIIYAVLAMEGLVIVYYYRFMFFFGFLFLATWPLRYIAQAARGKQLSVYWGASCIAVAIFSLLPVRYGDSPLLVQVGALAILGSAVFLLFRNRVIFVPRSATIAEKIFCLTPILFIPASAFLVASTTHSLNANLGLPLLNLASSWLIFGISNVVLFIPLRQHFVVLLVKLYLCIASTMILLSISYEVLFYFALAIHLVCWVLVECDRHMESDIPNRIAMGDLRRAVLYMVLSYAAIFGTGNVASISSFEMSSTYRLVTVFSPFLMTSLLVWKLMAPVVLVTCTYAAMAQLLRVPREACFLLVIMLADIMTLNFFYMVRDEGSWQEIGASIGHFTISNFFIILQLLLFTLTLTFLRGANFSVNHKAITGFKYSHQH